MSRHQARTEPAADVAPATVEASEPAITPYLVFLLACVILVEFFDSFATSFRYHMTTYVREDFGVPLPHMLGILSWVYLGSCLGFVPRIAADVFGRRLVLSLSMVALCVLQWAVGFARTPAEYAVLLTVLAVFYKADIWMIVMSEEAPRRHRGLYTALPILIGGAGALAVGELVHRMGAAPDAWRAVARFPIWGVALAVPLFLGMRETRHFRERPTRRHANPMTLVAAPFQRGYARPLLLMILFKTMIGAGTGTAVGLIGTEFLRVANGFDASLVGRVIQLQTVAMMAGAVNAGWISDRIGRLNAARLFALCYATALVAMGTLPTGSPGVWLCFVVQAHFAEASMYLLRVVSLESFPNDCRATGAAWTDVIPTVIAMGTARGLSALTAAGVSLPVLVVAAATIPMAAVPLYALLRETREVDLATV